MHWGNLEIRCECIVEIDTVLGVRWCVGSTLFWINTAKGVD